MLIAGTFSYAVARSALDIVGAAYSRAQEQRADAAARDFLDANGYDSNQYGDILYRLGEHHRQRGLSMASSLHDDHPTIQARLKALAYSTSREPALTSDVSYDRNIAQCLTFNARILIADDKYDLALNNLDRAVKSGLALEEAYVLKARALRYLASDTTTNREALLNLDLAVKFKTVGYNVAHLERGLLFFRLGEYTRAEGSFRDYLNGLTASATPGLDEQKTFAQEMILRSRLFAERVGKPATK
jgi:tetratricopeptide (TPR) repeat protein